MLLEVNVKRDISIFEMLLAPAIITMVVNGPLGSPGWNNFNTLPEIVAYLLLWYMAPGAMRAGILLVGVAAIWTRPSPVSFLEALYAFANVLF